jgi:hypothetical protein
VVVDHHLLGARGRPIRGAVADDRLKLDLDKKMKSTFRKPFEIYTQTKLPTKFSEIQEPILKLRNLQL